jgi:protein required for attachment to host cells
MTNAITWVVSANADWIRIFELDEAGKLKELEVIDNAQAQRRTASVGQAAVAGAASGVDHSAMRMNAHLAHGRRQGRYERLVMIAPEYMLPTLVHDLSPEVRATVILEINADIAKHSPATIRSSLPI